MVAVSSPMTRPRRRAPPQHPRRGAAEPPQEGPFTERGVEWAEEREGGARERRRRRSVEQRAREEVGDLVDPGAVDHAEPLAREARLQLRDGKQADGERDGAAVAERERVIDARRAARRREQVGE